MLENFKPNNVNLRGRDVKFKQLTNDQRHGTLQKLLKYMKYIEELEYGAIKYKFSE